MYRKPNYIYQYCETCNRHHYPWNCGENRRDAMHVAEPLEPTGREYPRGYGDRLESGFELLNGYLEYETNPSGNQY